MSEQEFELYLKLLSRCLNLTAAQREQIADELRDHLEERLEELARVGLPREKAVVQALDEFGDAAVLAARFATIARLKRRRFLMRLSLGSAACLAAVMWVASAFWPQNHAVQGPQQVAAQDKSRPAAPNPGKDAAPSKHAPAEPAVNPAAMSPTDTLLAQSMGEHPLSSDVARYARIEAALDAPVNFAIDPQPFRDAINFIADRFKIPILLDRKSLEDASVDAGTEVSLNLPGLKLREILGLLFERAATPLAFEIRDNVLIIATEDTIRSHKVFVVYDCRDLVQAASLHFADDGDEGAHPDAIAKGGGMGGGMFSTPVAAQGAKEAAPLDPKKTEPAKKLHHLSLVGILRNAFVDDENEASINDFGGLLVVRHNPLVQEQIKRFLADIRRIRKEGAFATLEKGTTASPAPVAVPSSRGDSAPVTRPVPQPLPAF